MNKNNIAAFFVAAVLASGSMIIFSTISPALAQTSNVTTTEGNTTASASTNNTTSDANTTISEDNSTFTARGSIAGLIFDFGETSPTSSMGNTTTSSNMSSSANLTSDTSNATSNTVSNGTDAAMASNQTATSSAEELQLPFIVAGDWDMGVADGNVTSFNVGFTMIHTDGTGRHTHELSNFQADNGTTLQLDENRSGMISGTVDVSLNGTEQWTDVSTTVMIERNNAIEISLDSSATDNHFQGQPIYGIVDSWLDLNGQELISEAREAATTAGETISDAGENLTESAEQVGNQTGNVVEDITNTTGNVIEDFGDSVADFFNNTGDQ